MLRSVLFYSALFRVLSIGLGVSVEIVLGVLDNVCVGVEGDAELDALRFRLLLAPLGPVAVVVALHAADDIGLYLLGSDSSLVRIRVTGGALYCAGIQWLQVVAAAEQGEYAAEELCGRCLWMGVARPGPTLPLLLEGRGVIRIQ